MGASMLRQRETCIPGICARAAATPATANLLPGPPLPPPPAADLTACCTKLTAPGSDPTCPKPGP